MKQTFILALTILTCLQISLYAQDTIIKRNKEQIECRIKEISEESIRYLKPDVSKDVVFVIDKDKVSKVIFDNGHELEFHPYLSDPENYANDKRNGLKFEFLGPIAGHAAIIYERSLQPGRSLEFSLGIAGLGQNVDNLNARGVTLKTGYKFIKSPIYYIKGQRYAHLLKRSVCAA